MATFKELKKCKTFKEILELLDDDNFDKFAMVMLLIWCAIPIVPMFGWIYYSRTINIPITCSREFSRTVVNILGIVTLIMYICFFSLRIKTKKVVFKGRFKNEPWIVFFLSMLVWAVIAAIASPNEFELTFGMVLYSEGILKYLFYAALLGFALGIKSPERKLTVIRAFTIIANIAMIIMVCQVWEIDFIAKYFKYNKAAMFFNSNHLGYYINMAVLCTTGLFLYDKNGSLKWKIFYILMFTFQYYTLILNDTFGCYLASIITIIVITVMYLCSGRSKKWTMMAPLLIAVVLSVLSGTNSFKHTDGKNVWENISSFANDIKSAVTHSSDISDRIKSEEAAELDSDNKSSNLNSNISSDAGVSESNNSDNESTKKEEKEEEFDIGKLGTSRMKLWINAVKDIVKRPILGYGPECWRGERPHNEILQHALFLGIPGLLFYLAALVLLLVKQLKKLKKLQNVTIIALGAVIGYFISSFFGLTMFYTVPYYFILLGFGMSIDTEGEK